MIEPGAGFSSHGITDIALAELARRTAILDAISYAATQIIGGRDWHDGIQELLDRLGAATEVSRVTLFEIHDGPDGRLAESCRYDWAESGYAKLSHNPRYQNISLVESDGQLNDWAAARQRGEIVQATLRDVTGETLQTFLEHGTQAFISVPIMLRSGVWGFLGLDDCRHERQWSDLEIDVLKTAAALIAGAIDRARSDEDLRRSRERYALAARGANDGLWDWDLVENTAYCAPRLYEILGLPEGSLDKSRDAFFNRLVDEDHRAARAYLNRCTEKGKRKFRFEARLKGESASPRWVVARGLIAYEGDKAVRLVGSLRDITAHKQAELNLRSSEARVRAILDTAFDAVISIGADGRIVEFNAAATRMFGHARELAIGRTVAELIIPPIYRAAHVAGMERYLQTGKSVVLNRLIEVEAMRADGGHFPIEISIAEVPLGEGRLFTAMIRDITERKRMEAQLGLAERQRAQLARHFSPNMVEEVMRTGGIGAVRTQPMAVLFADVYDYTQLSAAMSGEEVIALLRDFHAIIEDAVFNHGGTLDKYIGDGLMATFGTPNPGPLDATSAIAATRQTLRELALWNQRRRAAGDPVILIGVGLHFGLATLGDVGTAQRFELTVIGDTVNVASRIEQMSRQLEHAVIASDDLVQRAVAESGVEAIVEFRDLGEHRIRGREDPIHLWGLPSESKRS